MTGLSFCRGSKRCQHGRRLGRGSKAQPRRSSASTNAHMSAPPAAPTRYMLSTRASTSSM
eukprot:6218326-Pyramimonas_sp.AAC.1